MEATEWPCTHIDQLNMLLLKNREPGLCRQLVLAEVIKLFEHAVLVTDCCWLQGQNHTHTHTHTHTNMHTHTHILNKPCCCCCWIQNTCTHSHTHFKQAILLLLLATKHTHTNTYPQIHTNKHTHTHTHTHILSTTYWLQLNYCCCQVQHKSTQMLCKSSCHYN